jgi:hypothetical protein
VVLPQSRQVKPDPAPQTAFPRYARHFLRSPWGCRMHLRSRRSQYSLCLAAVLVATSAVHGPRFLRNLHRHHWEDWRFFRQNRQEIHSIPDCFTRPSVWPGLYRPLSTNCYYLLGRAVAGSRVEVYHDANLAVFVANSVLLFVLARRLLPWPLSLIPPVLFSSRLGHAQTLLYTTGFQALSGVFFALGALAVFTRRPRDHVHAAQVVSLLLFMAALLCYEPMVALAAIAIAYVRLFERAPTWRRYAGWLGVALVWAVLLVTLLATVGGGRPTGFSYDFSPAILGRYAAYLLGFVNGLVYPMQGTGMDMATRVRSIALSPLASAAVVLLGAAAVAMLVLSPRPGRPLRRAVRVTVFGLVAFLAGAAPFVVLEDRLFLRYTYFSHAGLAIALGGVAWMVVCLARSAARAPRRRGKTTGGDGNSEPGRLRPAPSVVRAHWS